MRRTVLKHDVVVNRYSLAEATQTRDALAKCLYNALFHWIVLRINHSLFRKESATANKANGLYIGILDIFGFEDENIRWTPIQYTDNTECVQMFSSKPYGLLRLVDEESNINNGTDQSMLEKLNTFLKTNEYYEVPHKREAAFIIAHYAGKVKYQISGFREKNKDLMRHDVMNVLKGSKSAFVRELVGEDPVAVFRWSLLRTTVRAMFAFRQAGKTKLRAGSVDRLELSTAQTPSMARRSSDSHLNAFLRGELPASIVPDFCDISVFKTIKERARKTPTKSHSLRLSYLRTLQALKGAVGQKAISNKPSSVSRQFGESLSRLMKTLGQATPYFIRCIKSNNEKVPNHFDDNIILRQLRYTGMLETVRIRRAGYSVRIEYESFVNQYRILLPKGLASSKNDIQEFMRCIPIIDSEENIQYGNTKIFMRDPEKLLLDDHLHRVIMEKILTLQRWIRAQLEHKRFKKFRQGVIKLQALTRGVLARIKMQRKHAAVICIQSWWRKVVAQRKYKMIRLTVVGIQSFARGNAQRKCLEELRSSKENMSRVSPRPMITRLTKTTLPKLDLNDPESLAAFASPDSFDSRDLDDELLLSIGEEEETDEDEEDEGEDGERLEEEMFELDDEKLAKHKREHPELALDADFILEDARLKLIQSHSYEAKRKMMQRRQSLAATTASARKHKMLRRAASTESDQIQDSTSKNKIPSSISKVCPKAKSSFLKATKQLKALLKKAGRQGAVDVGEGTHFEFDVIHSSSTRSSSKECDKLRFHQFKPSRVCKTDKCALCNRQMTGILMIQGLRCFGCKLIFHKDCANFASKIPCTTPLTSPNPIYKMSEAGRRPWDRIEFSVFIFKKQSHLGQQNKRETVVDAIFKRALREFHMELIGMEATLQANKLKNKLKKYFSQKGSTTLKYHDLIRTFEGLLTKICNEEKLTFPTTLGNI
uniref:Myosin motor domain-containing protein n=1 Tax=Meloidogyne hapla TaxID=6305 RepID=A0A1I8BZ14_MELHA